MKIFNINKFDENKEFDNTIMAWYKPIKELKDGEWFSESFIHFDGTYDIDSYYSGKDINCIQYFNRRIGSNEDLKMEGFSKKSIICFDEINKKIVSFKPSALVYKINVDLICEPDVEYRPESFLKKEKEYKKLQEKEERKFKEKYAKSL